MTDFRDLWEKISGAIDAGVEGDAGEEDSAAHDLLVWFRELCWMIDAEYDIEFDTLDEALEWFGDLPDEALDAVARLGRDNAPVREFLEIGNELLDEVTGAAS